MEPEGLLPQSQQSDTRPYSQSDQSDLYLPIPLTKDLF
jgi:hypothetical protein